MPNTTNFNWPTPADTDLVKDGAAAIRNLGNGIDTSLIDLKGGTTGQILSKASNADMDFTFITPNVGDITEVQAGVGISVSSGTGPIPIITNSSTDLITTAGDLLYGTAADTVARLGLGTAGQVLKVNSGATAPEWGAVAAPAFAGCSLKRSTMLTVATATVTDIGWDGEIFDTDGYHDNSTNNTRITIPSGKGGYYLFVHNQQSVNTVAATFISYRFFKNGVETYQVTNQTGTDTSGRVYGYQVYIVAAAVGDYFEVKVSQNSGGNVNYWFDNIATGLSNFSCTYLGA